MPEPDDILDRIDDAITGPDAMRSKPTPDARDEETPAPLALLLAMQGPQFTRLRDDAAGHVAELVGDAGVDRYRLGIVDVNVGDNSRANAERNRGAELVVEGVLRAIVAGDLAAPDRVRDHAAQLINTQQIPIIHGPALMTGPSGGDGVPTALPGNVAMWFDRFAARILTTLAIKALAEGRADITFIVLD